MPESPSPSKTQTLPPASQSWRSVWQAELRTILARYSALRQDQPGFFFYLLFFFFLVNTVCYWLALAASFPELIVDQLQRMLLIQLAVALLGGLFDSLSFFLTVYLVRRAAQTLYGLRFIAILSVDLVIAAAATAWVLLVVMLASLAIGPPQTLAATGDTVQELTIDSFDSSLPPTSQDEIAISSDIEPAPEADPPAREVAAARLPATPDEIVGNSEIEAVQGPVSSIREGSEPALDESEGEIQQQFYRDLLVRALQNPLANYRYFIFAIVMGFSTLLPTLFHIYMGARSYTLQLRRQ